MRAALALLLTAVALLAGVTTSAGRVPVAGDGFVRVVLADGEPKNGDLPMCC
ncbi:hypothetical protein ACSHXN_45680 (plasmid) [Streptomyces sp. HUAS TT11]|uniref:hypothetical protein n=1 Tax=Streptomyces sp. HUAS TT11 TaxID=3447508 RepID=UPI003F656989